MDKTILAELIRMIKYLLNRVQQSEETIKINIYIKELELRYEIL